MSIPSYIFGGSTGQTADSVKRQRAIAEALMAKTASSQPHDLGSGLSAIGQALLARSAMAKAEKGETALADRQKNIWSALTGSLPTGGSALAYDPAGATGASGAISPAASADAGGSGLTGDISQYASAIKGVESGGKYDIVGPTHKTMGRALGAYQVMEANLPQWTKEAVGREVGADEFLKSPEIQDAVFANRFGGYVSKYGNPQDAASAWLTGRPRGAGNKAKDVFGTDSDAYVSKFNAGLGPQASAAPAPSQQPVQVASLDPSTGMDSALAYSPRRGMEAAQPPQQSASLAPLPPAREVAPNPVPPQANAQGFSPAILAALKGDPQFDGFSRDGGDVRGAPAAPAAPSGPQMAAQAPGMNLTVLMQVLSDPMASDDQRAFAAKLVENEMKRNAPLSAAEQFERTKFQYEKEKDKQAREKPTYGVIGKDQFGNEQYGWIDAANRTATPISGAPSGSAPGSADADIPPAPPGVDPKEWRKQFTERAATSAMPAKGDDVTSLRKEVQLLPSYKNLAQAAPIYRSMVEAAGRDTKASDLNMVYGLGKIMDPTSVVREGEIVMANDTQGLADKLNGFIAGIQGEGRLRPEAREQIMQEAFGRLSSYRQAFGQDTDFYTGIAQRNRMPVEDVIPNFGEFEQWKVPGATIREVPQPVAPPPAAAVPQAPAPGAPVAPPAASPLGPNWPTTSPGAAPSRMPANDGWQVLPNGVKIRVKQ